jgi:hypothetical protein
MARRRLNKNEKALLEALDTYLQQDAKLGLSIHGDDDKDGERSFAYLHEQINDMFAVKAAELTHAEGVCRAFTKVHNYKYLDDWSFGMAMDKEMITQAVPLAERLEALKFVNRIMEELRTEQQEWSERDAGFNPRLDEIRKISKPKQPNDFKTHSSPLNQKNVDEE